MNAELIASAWALFCLAALCVSLAVGLFGLDWLRERRTK